MIGIVDYGMGNVRSISNALEYLGADAIVTADPDDLAGAERLILPGVGAFGDAMANLSSRGLVEILHEEVLDKKKPFLGICLGMQLLARSSTEHGSHKGLGWLNAEVVRFDLGDTDLKIPHMGWNDIVPKVDHPLLAGLTKDQFCFYFVHSYHIVCSETADVVATAEYGYPFTVAVASENIFATQFHPEKSQDNGIQLLENFLEWQP